MRLKYYRLEPLYIEPSKPKSFCNDLRLIDKNLDVVFNRVSGRWEAWRLSQKGWEWILQIENDDETYRPLDNRTLKKLRDMDIIARWGSIENYENHLEEKQKKWKADQDKIDDHELKYDIKDNKVLWQRAIENAQSGIINDLPETKERKICSYSKEEK